MTVTIIAALASNRIIGRGNRMPWHISDDLKRFKALTLGHPVVMGRKTFESIGKPLPGRQMIIVTRDTQFRAEGCYVVRSVEEAIALARSRGETEVFVCGGAQIYAEALSNAKRFYVTLVEAQVEADAFFPEWEEHDWIEKQSSHHEADEKDQYASTFKLLEIE